MIYNISLDCTDDAMLEVREHIEKVVETLVGDDLDETSVIRLVNHPSCKYFSTYSCYLIIYFRHMYIPTISRYHSGSGHKIT